MKAVKKKDVTSEKEDVKANEAKKSTQKKKNKQKTKVEKNRNLYSWVLQPVLVSAICIVLCYFLMELLYLKPVDEAIHAQQSNAQAKALEINVSRYLTEQTQWVEGVSKYASLKEHSLSNKLALIKPELDAIHLLSVGKLDEPLVEDKGFSFASLDLLRRVAKGEKAKVEFFKQDGKWFFQVAAATAIEEQGTIEKGLLLVVFNLSGLTTTVQHYLSEYNGGAHILVEGIISPVLKISGGQQPNVVTVAAHIPGVKVAFFPSEASFQALDRMLIWIILAAVFVLLMVTFVVISRINLKAIKADLQRAAQMVSKALDSESSFTNRFQFGEVYAMANAIVASGRQTVAKYKKREALAAKSNTAPTAGAADSSIDSVEDEPLFDDDLFDIDSADAGSDDNDDLFDEDVAVVEEQAASDVRVDQSIFRAYDIRGIVDETLNPALVTMLGKAIASEAQLQGQHTLCVGYDGRLSSATYAEALVTGIVSTGVNAIVVGQVPTPMLYFATHHFETGSGVMITGSHNPSNYNGFKTMIAGNTISGDAIQKLYGRMMMLDFAVGQGERSVQDIERAYLDAILNDIAVAAPLKVVVDAGNGVAGNIAPELIEELGCEVIPLHCDVDGTFPNHHPDPSKPENLNDLRAAVQEHDADIGLAFDGDGDRIGIVTNTGKIIWPDRLLMLFAKDVVSRNPGADIIYDVKSSRRLNSLISSYGGRPVMWKSGHSFIKSKMKETGALLAGEMSGHIFFKERWFGFDDGLYSAARLLEILGVEDKTSDDVFSEFPEDTSTPEINIAADDSDKFSIIEQLCERKEQFAGGNVSTIDGLRVDYPTGWGLCRASNTTPALVLRFEADDEAALEEIKAKFVLHLKDIDASLDLNF